DKKFNSIFSSWVSRLDLKRDRKKTQSFAAFHKGYGVDVFYRNGKFFPKKPFFDKDKKAIYADSEKTGQNYKKYLIKNGKVEEDDTVVIFDDLAGNFNVPFDLGNTIFKRGLAKVAVGYAAKNGILRKNMKCIIDLDNNVIREKVIVSPFLPTAKSEGFFEENKHKSSHYPVHSLVLCANKKSRFIYCYVELFSAFQFYVLLDDEYEGEDIYKNYVYDLIGEKEIDYKEYASSIPDSSNVFDSMPSYRVIDTDKFIQLSHVSKKDLKFYCHRNYHAIEAFTNYYFINEKSKTLVADIA
ncbi:hypothetical protein AB4544_02815, partial [Vibrio sp. 10N.222.45.F7]